MYFSGFKQVACLRWLYDVISTSSKEIDIVSFINSMFNVNALSPYIQRLLFEHGCLQEKKIIEKYKMCI